jgi:apolipoprotein N-acyltransferase
MRARNSYLLALLSGILLLLSYPPFDLEFLAWFAFVPVLIAVYHETKAKRRGRLGQVAAICLAPIFVWLYNEADVFLPSVVAWPLGVIMAFAVAGYVVEPATENGASRQLPRQHFSYLPSGWQIFLMPILVTAAEFLLMNIPVVMKVFGALGFFSVSRTQWLNPPVLQLASFTGMYGVTFLIWLVNSALAYGIVYFKETKRISKQAVMALLVSIMILGWGWISIPGVATGDTNVVIIQAKPSVLERQHVNELYADLSEHSLKYEPQVILWSLWASHEQFEDVGPVAGDYADFSKEHDIYIMDFNSMVFPDGRIEYCSPSYHFMNLFEGLIPFDRDKIMPEIEGFDTEFGKVGLLLCMESAATIPAGQLAKSGAQFIAVTSGDKPVLGAFPGLIGGNVAFRAVEHRIYAALFFRDSGSIIVDPYGRIIDDVALEEEIVAGKVAFTSEGSFYSRHGDIFSFTVLASCVALIGYNLHLKRRSPYRFCKRCRTRIDKGTEICPVCGKKQ